MLVEAQIDYCKLLYFRQYQFFQIAKKKDDFVSI